jgi:hypothetical protein
LVFFFMSFTLSSVFRYFFLFFGLSLISLISLLSLSSHSPFFLGPVPPQRPYEVNRVLLREGTYLSSTCVLCSAGRGCVCAALVRAWEESGCS